MTTLRHAIKISASRDRVFNALTDFKEVAAWHLGSVTGKIAVGSVMHLNPKAGLTFGFETKELVPNERLTQTCVEGPGSSAGRTLVIKLSDAGAGSTQVELTHGDWAENDAHLAFCNTNWGEALHRLKRLVEQGRA